MSACNAWTGGDPIGRYGQRVANAKELLLVAAALAGFADAHAVAISTASLAAAGTIGVADTVPVILTGFTTNTISKVLVAAVLKRKPLLP